MREKGTKRKEKKILIRVNREEKKLAEDLAKKEGKNTSEFFRSLLEEHKISKLFEDHTAIIAEYRKLLEEYKKNLK